MAQHKVLFLNQNKRLYRSDSVLYRTDEECNSVSLCLKIRTTHFPQNQIINICCGGYFFTATFYFSMSGFFSAPSELADTISPCMLHSQSVLTDQRF